MYFGKRIDVERLTKAFNTMLVDAGLSVDQGVVV